MANQYFVIVDERDSDKLRMFEYNTYQSQLEKLGYQNTRFWAFSEKDNDNFKKIQIGDTIYFSIQNDASFSFSARVSGQEESDLAIKIWGDDFRTRVTKTILFFDKFTDSSIGYSEMLHSAENPHEDSPGIYQIVKKFQERKSREISDEFPKELLPPVDLAGPPPKIRSYVTRFIRDTKKTRELKTVYQNKCQICNYQIKKPNNEYYSEAHHVWPLGAKPNPGDDDFTNMLVLCPTHHAEFDYGVIRISKDGKNIIDRNGEKVSSIHYESNHEITQKNIDYQLRNIE